MWVSEQRGSGVRLRQWHHLESLIVVVVFFFFCIFRHALVAVAVVVLVVVHFIEFVVGSAIIGTSRREGGGSGSGGCGCPRSCNILEHLGTQQVRRSRACSTCKIV